MIKKIVSGGQTGADQAALDAAISMNVPHGGWVPKGRMTEKGILSEKYKLREITHDSYAKRTEKNVLDSDGTLIVSHGVLTGGSELTRILSRKYKKPCHHLDLNAMDLNQAVKGIKTWIKKNHIQTLNVAGPRESHDPKIYRAVKKVILKLLKI